MNNNDERDYDEERFNRGLLDNPEGDERERDSEDSNAYQARLEAEERDHIDSQPPATARDWLKVAPEDRHPEGGFEPAQEYDPGPVLQEVERAEAMRGDLDWEMEGGQ